MALRKSRRKQRERRLVAKLQQTGIATSIACPQAGHITHTGYYPPRRRYLTPEERQGQFLEPFYEKIKAPTGGSQSHGPISGRFMEEQTLDDRGKTLGYSRR